MTLALCWAWFPAVLVAVSLGGGLALERAMGARLPGALLAPAGLAVVVVVSQLAIAAGAHRDLTLAVVLAVAVAGYALGVARLRDSRPCGIAVALFVAVLAIYGAPVLLSGAATFAGYIQLDDAATFLAATARYLEHGRSLAGLAPSTYEATVSYVLGGGYPLGSMLPPGVLAPLTGQDMIWLYQPWLASMAAMLALCVWSLVRPLLGGPWRAALVSALAAQPAILYAYALQGSVKEVATAWLLALTAALSVPLLRAGSGARATVGLLVALGAMVSVVDLATAAWAGPVVLGTIVAVVALRRGERAGGLGGQALVLGVVVALAGAVALHGSGFLARAGNLHVLEGNADKGNLRHPLSALEIFGVWPTGDHRTPLGSGAWLAYALIAAMALAAAFGFVELVRRHHLGVAVYVGGAVVAWALVTAAGGAWVDAKALAIAAPAVVLAALLGAAALARINVAGAAILVAGVGAGILYSNALAYRDANLAPRDRLAAAQRIGERFAGQGPTLDNEYEPYAARYLLRRTDAEGPSELRRRYVLLSDGRYLLKGAVADLDLFRVDQLLVYRTIVVPRNPAASRPPSVYRLVWRGRFYDVWQRPSQPTRQIEARMAVGDYAQAAVVPACRDVLAFARRARRGSGARLVAAERPEPVGVPPLALRTPPAWTRGSVDPRRLLPGSIPGAATGAVTIPSAGRWNAYLGGSFARGFIVWIDGRRVGAARFELHNLGQYTRLGQIALAAGTHSVRIVRNDLSLHPGSGSRLEALGPLALEPAGARERLVTLAPASARRLCGRSLDWIELDS